MKIHACKIHYTRPLLGAERETATTRESGPPRPGYDQDLRPRTGRLAARSTRGRACAGVLAHRHANGLGVQQVRNERPRAHAYTRVTSTSRSHTHFIHHTGLSLCAEIKINAGAMCGRRAPAQMPTAPRRETPFRSRHRS